MFVHRLDIADCQREGTKTLGHWLDTIGRPRGVLRRWSLVERSRSSERDIETFGFWLVGYIKSRERGVLRHSVTS